MSSRTWSELPWRERWRFLFALSRWSVRFALLENEPREGRVSLMGSAAFLEHVKEGLGLLALRAPHAYQLIQHNLWAVMEGPLSIEMLQRNRLLVILEEGSHHQVLDVVRQLALAAFRAKYLRQEAEGSAVPQVQQDGESASFLEEVMRELRSVESAGPQGPAG